MAEFQEVMRQWKRMCLTFGDCEECPQYREYQCYNTIKRVFECGDVEPLERNVLKWAKEHPEPKYPTWREYLQEQGVLDVEYISAASSTTSTSKSYVQTVKTLAPFYRPIPADIAQKLGIEPKELKNV